MILNELSVMLAQTAPAPPMQQDPRAGTMVMMGMVVLAMIAMWFVTSRAQNKKARELDALLKTMKPGDKVVTTSGIMGVVVSVKEKSISLRSAESKLEVLKSAVSGIIEREGEAGVSESKAS
jgi:preprotein translocase subunit YajC